MSDKKLIIFLDQAGKYMATNGDMELTVGQIEKALEDGWSIEFNLVPNVDDVEL